METAKSFSDLRQSLVVDLTSTGATAHAFSDADLSQLREQIKKIMIPKLIRVFELKLSAQQAAAPPSRLTGHRPESSKLYEIREELNKMKEDMKLLLLWCGSCQKQVDKALDQVEAAIEGLS